MMPDNDKKTTDMSIKRCLSILCSRLLPSSFLSSNILLFLLFYWAPVLSSLSSHLWFPRVDLHHFDSYRIKERRHVTWQKEKKEKKKKGGTGGEKKKKEKKEKKKEKKKGGRGGGEKKNKKENNKGEKKKGKKKRIRWGSEKRESREEKTKCCPSYNVKWWLGDKIR